MSNIIHHTPNGKAALFVHIPKTGGISVCNALGLPVRGHENYRSLSSSVYFNYSFTFVRDPYTRFVSAFHFLNNGGVNKVDAQWGERLTVPYNGDILAFATSELTVKKGYDIMECEHFKPQTEFVKNFSGNVTMDFIGRFESLYFDFNDVCSALGFQNRNLPHENKGLYTPEKRIEKLEELLRVHYVDDYINFKY